MIFVILAILFAPLLRRAPRTITTRIVVVQAAKIGDFVCTTPLIRNLKQAFPSARICLITNATVAGLAIELPFIDEVIEFPADSTKGFSGKIRWISRLRKEHFDMAFCCNGGVAWPGILAMAGIPVRLGITPNFQGKSTALAQRLWTGRAEHRSDQLIGTSYALMASLVGIEKYESYKEVRPTSEAVEKMRRLLDGMGKSNDAPRIGIAVSSANKLKELGAPMLAAICQSLLEKLPDATLLLLGTSGDHREAEHVMNRLPAGHGRRVVNSCGRFSLGEIPGLISELDVFVGVDSGLTYIADALNIPLVSIAGPCNMRETRPTNASAVIIQHDLPCSPCAHIFHAPYSCHLGTRKCIKDIKADEVVAKILDLCARARESGRHSQP